MSRERGLSREHGESAPSERESETGQAKRSRQREAGVKHGGNTAAEKRARDLIAIVNSQVKTAEEGTSGGKASEISRQKLAAMTTLLVTANGELMEAVVNLPSGSELQLKAFEASERAVAVIDRLESLQRAHAARAATQPEAAQGDAAEMFDKADRRVPLGYCDRPSTAQRQAPCELDPGKRANYRDAIRDWATTVHINWSAAVGAVLLDEKTRPRSVSFEQKLGEVLLGLVFNLLTYGAGTVLKIGFDAATKSAHEDARWNDGVFAPGAKADTSDLDMIKKGAELGISKGADFLETKLKEPAMPDATNAQDEGTMSMHDLATRATKVSASFPADRVGFVAALKDVPSQWSSNIQSNVKHLLDADLAALVVQLPRDAEIAQSRFERKIEAQLTRFSEQVKAVNRGVRPVKIVAPSGKLRHALIAREEKAEPDLHGEWRGAPVRTGKWTFIRWIDDDLADMAVHEAMNTGTIHDETASFFTAWANDSKFWSDESLTVLNEWSTSKQVR